MAGDKLIYDVEYFTSSQVSLYIGGIFIDEAASIQYGVQESKAPVYGYASRRFDAVIAGNVLVNGGILLNFIDSGYIFAVLKNLFDADGTPERFLLALQNIKSPKDSERLSATATALLENGFSDNLDRQRVLSLLAIASSKNKSGQERGLTSLLAKTSKSEDLRSGLENVLWGKPFSDLTKDQAIPNPVDYKGFDIQVDYGFAEKYGNITSRTPSFTRRIIKNCNITGTNQVIDSRSGEPVQEGISFMARDYE